MDLSLYTVLPVIAPFDFDGPMLAGESVQLNCYVTKADRPLIIQWHFNGSDVNNFGISTSMFNDRTNILAIDAVGPEHSGVYTCIATNKAGSSKYSAILLVNGP